MADRKVYVEVMTRLIIRVDEGVDVSDVLSEMDYDFKVADFDKDRAEIEDMEIRDWDIKDSK